MPNIVYDVHCQQKLSTLHTPLDILRKKREETYLKVD